MFVKKNIGSLETRYAKENLYMKFFYFLFLFSCIFTYPAFSEEIAHMRCDKKSKHHKKTIAPELKGAAFFSSKQCLEKDESNTFDGIQTIELDLPDRGCFCKTVKCFLGKPISDKLLKDIKIAVINYYKSFGAPLVSVVIPEGQEITNGVLKILILRAKLGKLKACGAKHYDNEKIASKIRTCPGEEIDYFQMLDDLVWINKDPYLETDLIYEPGVEAGYTDITLQTCDRYPFSTYVGYENTGNFIGGNSRYFIGADIGNLLGRDNVFRYQFVSASNTNKWYSHTGNATIPFPCRHILDIYGVYNQAVGTTDEMLDGKGDSWQVNGNYIIPINYRNLQSNLFAGYQFKRTNNFLNFGIDSLFNDYFDISQFILGYEGTYSTICGLTSFGLTLYISPGKMTSYNRSSVFREQRDGAEADYVFAVFNFGQYLQFYRGFAWVLEIKAQASSTKLLPMEEFSIGGFYTVRGYDENEVVGDFGLLIKNELRTPNWCPGGRKDWSCQALLFCDFGAVWDADENIIADNSTILASIGPGVRMQFCERLIGRLDYGWQLHDIVRLIGDNDIDGRFHISASINFCF